MAAPAEYLASKAKGDAVEQVIREVVRAMRKVAERHSDNAAHWCHMIGLVADELENPRKE